MSNYAQIDPDVKIPAAVKAAAARSEELHKTLRDNPPPGEGEGDEPVTPGVTPDTDASSLAGPDPKPDAEPTAKPEDAAAKPAGQQPVKGDDDETWEHKYKSVYGRYQRSQAENRRLADQVQNLEGIIASMQAAPAKTDEPASKMPDFDFERLLTDEEISDYGEDFLKVVGKRAREEFAPAFKALRGYEDEIARLKKQLEGVTGFVQQDAQQKLLSKLDEQLPDWRDLNTNQEFLDWLALPDPYSGGIRHDMLKAAYAQGNAHRVLAFFNGFLAEEAAVAPVTAEPDASETRISKVPLQTLAAPGRAKTAAATTAPAEKPIITRAQVAAFYADIAAGKYRGKDDAKNKAEAEIFAAQRDGRIR